MIATIVKGGYAKGLINYHELKVERGRAERILDTTFAQNKEQRAARILNAANANPSKKLRNKFAHISISFAKGESLAPEIQRQIADKYLQNMGYWNCPRVIYQHSDTKNNHFHIVTTTIDNDGKKVNDFNDHRKSQTLSRQIEKEFGLQVTEYTKQESYKVQELNAKKYKLAKGIEKIEQIPLAFQKLTEVLTKEEQDKIREEKLPDVSIIEMIKLRDGGDQTINQLYRLIRQYDAEYKTDKDKLRDRLNYIKQISSSRDDFMKKVTEQGLYVRKISKGENVNSLTYGFPETNFYVHEKSLPVALRYDYLFTDRKITLAYDPESQKRFLKSVINRSLRQSSTLDEFQNNLKKAGINFEYASNTRGIYGISFSSENLKDAQLFKGSELGISWNRIAKDFNVKGVSVNAPKIKADKPSKEMKPYIPKGIAKSLDTTHDDEEKKKKRKDRDQDMDRE